MLPGSVVLCHTNLLGVSPPSETWCRERGPSCCWGLRGLAIWRLRSGCRPVCFFVAFKANGLLTMTYVRMRYHERGTSPPLPLCPSTCVSTNTSSGLRSTRTPAQTGRAVSCVWTALATFYLGCRFKSHPHVEQIESSADR